ncbi:putative radical SAM superfamily Fe-S cluster-containing enzyme [Lachnospiraceae bacterium PFB1-21]
MSEIREKIESIIDKYWQEDEEYYSQYRYEGEEEKEFDIQKEVGEFLKNARGVTDCKIEFEEGFSSCAYDNDFLAICWICNGELDLLTVLLEVM